MICNKLARSTERGRFIDPDPYFATAPLLPQHAIDLDEVYSSNTQAGHVGLRHRVVMEASGQVTRWLVRLREGDEAALERLVPLLYEELRLLARKQLRSERPGHTLNTTALVNEAYLRLVEQHQLRAEDRPQFFAIAATTMRRILVDYARTRKRLKRGGGQVPIPLDEAEPFLTEREADEVLALDAALDQLATVNERASQVVQYRFYSGLTLEETAQVLGVSIKTVQRDWTAARAWLRKEIAHEI